MTINRGQIALYLGKQFSSLATAIAQTSEGDDDNGYGPDIDNALRDLGVAEDALGTAEVDEDDRKAAFALAEYYTLRRIWRQLGNRFKTQIEGVSVDYADQRKNVKDMMDEAAERCAELGYSTDGRTLQTVRFQVF